MSDKRYRVTVEFAHGIRHVFDGISDVRSLYLERWAVSDDDQSRVMPFLFGSKTYYLNRDYLCSMVVEELEG
jgi:hypothetical protein